MCVGACARLLHTAQGALLSAPPQSQRALLHGARRVDMPAGFCRAWQSAPPVPACPLTIWGTWLGGLLRGVRRPHDYRSYGSHERAAERLCRGGGGWIQGGEDAHTHRRIHSHAQARVCTDAQTHARTGTRTYTHAHVHIRTCTRTCTHTRMYTHAHAHKGACMCAATQGVLLNAWRDNLAVMVGSARTLLDVDAIVRLGDRLLTEGAQVRACTGACVCQCTYAQGVHARGLAFMAERVCVRLPCALGFPHMCSMVMCAGWRALPLRAKLGTLPGYCMCLHTRTAPKPCPHPPAVLSSGADSELKPVSASAVALPPLPRTIAVFDACRTQRGACHATAAMQARIGTPHPPPPAPSRALTCQQNTIPDGIGTKSHALGMEGDTCGDACPQAHHLPSHETTGRTRVISAVKPTLPVA